MEKDPYRLFCYQVQLSSVDFNSTEKGTDKVGFLIRVELFFATGFGKNSFSLPTPSQKLPPRTARAGEALLGVFQLH